MFYANIHSITPFSKVNGPGTRTVVHFQGCTLNCPGCFNPETHDTNNKYRMSLEDVLSSINNNETKINGVTISGGEPMLQQDFLLQLLKELKNKKISVVMFSGFYLHEIKKTKHGKEILNHLDALVDGRFDENTVSKDGLHGSNNQTIHLFSNTYKKEDFEKRETEIWFDEEGNMCITGFPSADILDTLK